MPPPNTGSPALVQPLVVVGLLSDRTPPSAPSSRACSPPSRWSRAPPAATRRPPHKALLSSSVPSAAELRQASCTSGGRQVKKPPLGAAAVLILLFCSAQQLASMAKTRGGAAGAQGGWAEVGQLEVRSPRPMRPGWEGVFCSFPDL